MDTVRGGEQQQQEKQQPEVVTAASAPGGGEGGGARAAAVPSGASPAALPPRQQQEQQPSSICGGEGLPTELCAEHAVEGGDGASGVAWAGCGDDKLPARVVCEGVGCVSESGGRGRAGGGVEILRSVLRLCAQHRPTITPLSHHTQLPVPHRVKGGTAAAANGWMDGQIERLGGARRRRRRVLCGELADLSVASMHAIEAALRAH